MSANALANTAALVHLQDDLYQGLKSCSLFNNFQIVQYRKLRIQSVISADILWATGRNGKKGAGLLVEMPTFEVDTPNVTGPVKDMTVSVVAVEEPNVNFSPTIGTLVSAEELAECVLSFLHLWSLNQAQTIYAARNTIVPVTDGGLFQNLVAYRINCKLPLPRTQFTKCVTPIQSLNDQAEVVLTNGAANPGASIYYTLDHTFPANPTAQGFTQVELKELTSTLYDNPFVISSGQTLRWAAYQNNLLPSNVGYYLAP